MIFLGINLDKLYFNLFLLFKFANKLSLTLTMYMKKIVFFISFLWATVTLMAQSIEVTPVNLFFTAEPGESQTKYLKVKNHSSSLETFILKLSDYSVDSKGQGTYVEAGSMRFSMVDWISIAPSFFELNPNEEKEIAVTMNQPADRFGSSWGVIFIGTAKEQSAFSADKSLSAGIALSGRIAVNIYQTPGNNKAFKATISNMSEITEDGDSIRTFTALVNNLEDIITPCKVYLIATNIHDGEETSFDEIEFTMYPKSSRRIELEVPDVLPNGQYSLAAILDYGNNANLEGTQLVISVE